MKRRTTKLAKVKSFTVHGEIKGKERPRMTYQGGYPRQYTTPATRAQMKLIASEYVKQCGRAFSDWDDEVWIAVEYSRAMPESKRRVRVDMDCEPDTYKPDADNVLKLVLDALNGIAWRDDKTVTRVSCKKLTRKFGIKPNMRIQIAYIANGFEDDEEGKESD